MASTAEESIPTKESLEKAGNITIYDVEAKPVLFKSLINDGHHKRVMVIFIRHFFCGVCQEYLKALAAGISPSSLPQDVSIAIVGCGAPSLIASYLRNIGFEKSYPFPVYADQSRELHRLFEMQSNLDMPAKSPQYFQRSLFAVVSRNAVQMVKRTWHGDAASGGPFAQNGGELLFEVEGDQIVVSWCHRMQHTQNHVEVEELRRILKLEDKLAS